MREAPICMCRQGREGTTMKGSDIYFNSVTQRSLYVQISKFYNKPLKSRLNLLLNILYRPLTPRLLTPHGIDLCLCETLRLCRWVIS